ncbi:MAG: SDR family oxidoreductase [Pirellulales bacterium]
MINISSVHELTPTRFSAPHGMSKGGMLLLMRELALEYSRFGITVNNVAPGAIHTDINQEVLADPAYEAKVIAKIPAGLIGEPEDVSKAVLFPCAKEARYVTGTSIVIDGGLAR